MTKNRHLRRIIVNKATLNRIQPMIESDRRRKFVAFGSYNIDFLLPCDLNMRKMLLISLIM